MVKVSVILPAYNSATHIQQTLDSVLSQTGNGSDFSIELIVVDDCSTDGTKELLSVNGIRFLSTGRHSGGPNKGRNIGLEYATGDVICLIDHDDIWAQDKIKKQLAAIEKYPIVYSGYSVVDLKKNRIISRGKRTHRMMYLPPNDAFLQKITKSKRGIQVYPGAMMFDASLRHIRFEEIYGQVDFDWQLRLFEGRPVAVQQEPLLTRFMSGNNLSLSKAYREIDYRYSIHCLDQYAKHYPQEVATAKKRMNGSMARYFYLTGEMEMARTYFRNSVWDLKTLLYYCTTFYGDQLVKKHFRVFG